MGEWAALWRSELHQYFPVFFFFHNCGSCYENTQISCCFHVYKVFIWCVTVFKSLNAACSWYSGIFSDCSDVTSSWRLHLIFPHSWNLFIMHPSAQTFQSEPSAGSLETFGTGGVVHLQIIIISRLEFCNHQKMIPEFLPSSFFLSRLLTPAPAGRSFAAFILC